MIDKKHNADYIIRAKQLVSCAGEAKLRRGAGMLELGIIEDGACAVSGDKILAVGTYKEISEDYDSAVIINTNVALPGLIDSHTHPVFSGTRTDEYILKSRGADYLEILKSGGGILGTVRSTRSSSDDELINLALNRLDFMLMNGSTTIEAKSGYGLSLKEEIRHLRLLKYLNEIHPITIIPTLLGAHAVPKEYKKDEYVSIVCEEMIPMAAQENLAEFVDVFCEEGAFNLKETEKIIEKAHSNGLKTRIHAEQFNNLGAAFKAAEMGAFSADHLMKLSYDDAEKISKTNMVCCFLPGCEFFLNKKEYPPARLAIDKNAAISIATDFNAGTCLTESMPMVMSVAVLQMGLLSEEAIIAGTINPAISLDRGNVCGSLEADKQADIILLNVNDYRSWLYHFGVNMIGTVIKSGKKVYETNNVKYGGK